MNAKNYYAPTGGIYTVEYFRTMAQALDQATTRGGKTPHDEVSEAEVYERAANTIDALLAALKDDHKDCGHVHCMIDNAAAHPLIASVEGNAVSAETWTDSPPGYQWGTVISRSLLHIVRCEVYNTTALCGVNVFADSLKDTCLEPQKKCRACERELKEATR